MSHFTALLESSPFTVFLAVLVGVLVGSLEYRGFSLGSSGTLFAGLALGFLGFRVDPGYLSLSLVMFIAAVGLLAAAAVDEALLTHGLKFVTIGVVMTAAAFAATTALVVLFADRVDPWLLRASFFGTLTSTPGLAAAIETAPPGAGEQLRAGYSITYVIGLGMAILFQEVAPLVLRLDMAAERRTFLETLGIQRGPEAVEETSTSFSLAGFALAIVLGAFVDQVHLPLGPLGTMTLSLGGGTLVAAIVIGYLGHVGPVDTRMDRNVLARIQDVALAIFLAVVGVQASATFVDAFRAGGVLLLSSTLVVGGAAILAGYVLAVHVWGLSWISTAGAIAGGLTSTPSLGAAVATTGGEEVGATYAATYPFALLGMVVFSKLLVLLA